MKSPSVQYVRQIITVVLMAMFAQATLALEVAHWQEDLEFLAEKLSTKHADPWKRKHKPAFDSQVADLARRLQDLDDAQITLEMMRLVASFNDGHTKLLPTGSQGFRNWYPIRMHEFSDGVYLTSMPEAFSSLKGMRITQINTVDARTVLNEVGGVFGADNRFGRRAFAFLASNADLLAALGIVRPGGALVLELTDASGRVVTQDFAAEVVNDSMEFRFWGEMFGPGGDESRSAWGTPALEFLTRADKERPLHLRQRNAYYWEVLEDTNSVYFQLNYMTHQSSQAELDLIQTWEAALAASRDGESVADRFIIDLRYNFGGDGSLTKTLVNRLLRGYPRALDAGRVFVITSGATFSAGVMMVEEIMDHIPAVIAGEPMGAPYNHYGDAESFDLPNSGFQLDISRRYWQLSESDDHRRFIPVKIPAPMSGDDYFGGADPVLDHVLTAASPYPTLELILIEQGSEAAERAYHERAEAWGDLDYWLPVGRMDLERAAESLMAAGRTEDAMTAYRINTWVFPDDWDTWDDLGDICLQLGLDECVLDSYARALALNPSNWNSSDQKEAMTQISNSR